MKLHFYTILAFFCLSIHIHEERDTKFEICFFIYKNLITDGPSFPGANFARLPVGPSGHGWPYSGDQDLVTIVGPTMVVSVLPTLAVNTGNQRCARPSAQLWPRLEPTVGPTLAN